MALNTHSGILGIDVGGSAIKAAVIDPASGELLKERVLETTPIKPTPENVAQAVRRLVRRFSWAGLVGCSFPTVIVDGVSRTAGNLHSRWRDCAVAELLGEATACSIAVINDADAAGMAEMTLGAGRGLAGKVIVVTIGTGLGSGFFHDGRLVPNFELGRVFARNGVVMEFSASGLARSREGLSWQAWAERFNGFLAHLDRIFSPDHIILGGGVSAAFEEFSSLLQARPPITVARFRNNAGMVGAAMYAFEMNRRNNLYCPSARGSP